MKKKKINRRKLLFMILIPILVIVLVVVGVMYAFAGNHKEESNFLNSFEAEGIFVNNCVDKKDTDCFTFGSTDYKTYSYHYDNKDIQDLVDKLNKKVLKIKQEEAKKGTVNYEECKDVQDKYKYRYLTSDHLEYFDYRDKIVSLSFELTTQDYCTGEVAFTSEVYNYDKEKGGFVESQEEMFQLFHTNPESINEIIVRYAKQYEERDIDPTKIVNYRLAYNHNSRLIIQYQLEGDSEWYYAYRAPNKDQKEEKSS